jgi:uncharacterized membrane protein
MTPRWERTQTPPANAALIMDAVLTPHRSLSLGAFKLMLAGVIAVNAVTALVFISQGAFPVAGFLGLDVLALWLAFRWNYRAARIEERVRVGAEQVTLTRRSVNGAEAHWVVSPLWARVDEDSLSVVIRAGGGAQRVGAFLSPPERASFARALDAALWRAKKGGTAGS